MGKTLPRILALALVEGVLLAFLIAQSNPIWTDEVLQFVTGSIPSFSEAARVIFGSIKGGLNHGQTGFHMLLNYALFRAFGASYLTLRGPSYFAYVAGPAFGFFFLLEAGVSTLVGFLFVFGLGLSQLNLVHGWEARPYMLLQGTVLAFLWAWQRYTRGGATALVFVAGAAGILSHPFFIAYAGMVVAGEVLFSPASRQRLLLRLRERRSILIAGTAILALLALFLFVGSLSWFHTMGTKFGYDPYQFIGRNKSLPRFMLGTFFFPVGMLAIPVLVLLSAALLWFRCDENIKILVPIFLSLLLALFVTQFVVGYSVLKSQYWLLQRQWIAGNALAFLLAAVLLEFLVRKARLPERVASVLLVFLLLVGVSALGLRTYRKLGEPKASPLTREQADVLLSRAWAAKYPLMGDLEQLARQNLLEGGPVWPVFRRYYEPEFHVGAPH